MLYDDDFNSFGLGYVAFLSEYIDKGLIIYKNFDEIS